MLRSFDKIVNRGASATSFGFCSVENGGNVRVNCHDSVLAEKQGDPWQALRLCEVCLESNCRLSVCLFCFCHFVSNLHVISLASCLLSTFCLSFQGINSSSFFQSTFQSHHMSFFLNLYLFWTIHWRTSSTGLSVCISIALPQFSIYLSVLIPEIGNQEGLNIFRIKPLRRNEY